ncbi:hypothetical protein ACVBEQ_20215 [Nakamurella sp. GG22]
MDRRAAGAVVLIAAVLVALAIPTVTGRRIAGSAARLSTADAPELGQCLSAAPEPTLAYGRVTAFAAPAGPCGAANYGEMVFVAPDFRAFPSTMVFDRTSFVDPGDCDPPAREYLGWEPAGSSGSAGPTDTARALADWRPVLTQTLVLIGPDKAQFLAGQRWIGCAMLPRKAPYSGSLRTGAASGAFPAADAYGSCRAQPSAAGRRELPCSVAHDAEIFGWSATSGWGAPTGGSAEPGPAEPGPAASDEESIMASCRALVTAVTGMIDPSAGGSLRVVVETDRASEAAGSGRATCLVEVVADSRLGGGLTWIRPQGR